MKAPNEAIRQVALPFFEEDAARPLYLAECCGRLYVGISPAEYCRTCKQVPQHVVVTSREDLQSKFPV
jgi:hypothetical protein